MRNCTIHVAEKKALISFTVTAKLICAFVFTQAKITFSHCAALVIYDRSVCLSESTAMVVPGRCLHFIGLLPNIEVSRHAKCAYKYIHLYKLPKVNNVWMI